MSLFEDSKAAIEKVEEQIKKVEAKIEKVEAKIEKVEARIENEKDAEEKKALRDNKNALHEEKMLLLKEDNLLNERLNTFLAQQQQPSGKSRRCFRIVPVFLYPLPHFIFKQMDDNDSNRLRVRFLSEHSLDGPSCRMAPGETSLNFSSDTWATIGSKKEFRYFMSKTT